VEGVKKSKITAEGCGALYESGVLSEELPSTIIWLVDYREVITIEPGKRRGKPCIRGLRITVYDVLEYLASGMSHAEILQDFPYLREDDILACLAFAADRERRTAFVAGEAH
jgi:uncharacterized protein (DUF433 family)